MAAGPAVLSEVQVLENSPARLLFSGSGMVVLFWFSLCGQSLSTGITMPSSDKSGSVFHAANHTAGNYRTWPQKLFSLRQAKMCAAA